MLASFAHRALILPSTLYTNGVITFNVHSFDGVNPVIL